MVQEINNIERRTFSAPISRKMEDGKESRTVMGYAAMFNSQSEALFGSWVEEIAPGAFDETDMSDVRALFNHDDNKILARTPGTLSLEVDAKGLRYEFSMPHTTYGDDLIESMSRGDVSQSSFGFTVEEDEVIYRDNEKLLPLRRILKIGRLFDVSPVTYPAYPETTSEVRSRFGGAIPAAVKTINTENNTDEIFRRINAYSEMLLVHKELALDGKRG